MLGWLGEPLPIRHDPGLPTLAQVAQMLSLRSLAVMRAGQIERGYRTPAEIMAEAMLLDGWEHMAQYTEEELRDALIEYRSKNK